MLSDTGAISAILSRLRRTGVCLLPLIAVVPAAFSLPDTTGPQLTLDSVNVRQEGVVSFSVLSLGPDGQSEFPAPRFLLGQTDDQTFRLYVDVDSIQQVRFNAFTFTAYLNDPKLTGQKTYRFQITGNPTGSFRDAPVRISFHVKNGSSNATGGILMPVYNAAKTDLVSAEEQKDPAYVSVSGSTPVAMRLANVPDSLAIAVTEVAISEGCPKCWTQVSSAVTEAKPLVIEPGTNVSLPINLVANSIPALLQGAILIKPEVPHDTLALTLIYHTLPGGADRKQTIPYRIRFGPGLFGLALALCGGTSLGLLARYLLTDKLGKDNERALHAVISAFVLALIAEFTGVMLTSYGNSKLILFDLDIDPRQLFPAFILAMLVAGGSAVVSSVKGTFGKTS
jgi:hypothetical protein